MPAVEIHIMGKVQGVFFRASVEEKASALGLCGFAQNEKDGSVFLIAEGTQENLDNLIAWCHQGPPRARVDKVTVKPRSQEGFIDFKVKR